MTGNVLYVFGTALQVAGIAHGVNTYTLGAALIVYGTAILVRGFLP